MAEVLAGSMAEAAVAAATGDAHESAGRAEQLVRNASSIGLKRFAQKKKSRPGRPGFFCLYASILAEVVADAVVSTAHRVDTPKAKDYLRRPTDSSVRASSTAWPIPSLA